MGGAACRHRPDARARRAQGERQRGRHHRPASRTCRPAMRCARATSSRRCPARPSRSSTPTPRAGSCSPTRSGTRRRLQAEAHHRPRDADRRDHGRARQGVRGHVRQRRRAGGRITGCRAATGEKLWRMPLDKAFDKMMDSKYADMKNTGGRWGGAAICRCIPAALHPEGHALVPHRSRRHGHGRRRNDINQSWGAGWGVRLLDRFVAEHHEKSEK